MADEEIFQRITKQLKYGGDIIELGNYVNQREKDAKKELAHEIRLIALSDELDDEIVVDIIELLEKY